MPLLGEHLENTPNTAHFCIDSLYPTNIYIAAVSSRKFTVGLVRVVVGPTGQVTRGSEDHRPGRDG